jgi:hypothetical protein
MAADKYPPNGAREYIPNADSARYHYNKTKGAGGGSSGFAS